MQSTDETVQITKMGKVSTPNFRYAYVLSPSDPKGAYTS